MNNKFDELAKNMAQPITRKQALKKFGIGLVGVVLTCLGLTTQADADPHFTCDCNAAPFAGCKSDKGGCWKFCLRYCSGG